MRILHVLAERGFSGGEHQLRHVLEHLRRQGHASSLVLQPDGAFLDAARALELPVETIRMRNDVDLRAVVALRRLLRRAEVDLVHFACSRSHKLGVLAGLGRRRACARVTTRRMDNPMRRTRYRRWLYTRGVDCVITISEAVADEVAAIGVPRTRIRVVHDGIDTRALARLADAGERRRARAELGVGEDRILGLTLASLHERKGLDLLVAALARVVLPEGRRLRWVLAGEGPERKRLAELARGVPAGVEVELPGRVTPAEPLLAAADLFCLPSRREGLGVALLEAMARGLPVVATAVGGMREAVEDGVSGLLVPPEDPAALAAALGRLLSAPAEAEALGRRAAERARDRFDIDRMCRDTEDCYLGLCDAFGAT